MVFNAPRLSKGAYPRPSEDIDPKLKSSKPDYAMAMAKYIYSNYQRGKCVVTPTDQDKIYKLRSYAAGRQDSNYYKDILLGKETAVEASSDSENEFANIFKDRKGFYSIDFDNIFSPAPKYLDNIAGMFDAADFNMEVWAVDEHSVSIREETKYRDLIQGEFQSFFEYVNLTMGLPGEPQRTIPKNAEELEMFDQMQAYKLAYEVSMGHALKYTHQVSSDPKVRRKTIRDLCVLKKAVNFIDSDSSGVVKYKYIDIADTILEASNEEDGSDMTYGGVVIYETIADFRAHNPNITDEEARDLADQFNGVLGNSIDTVSYLDDGTATFDTFRIPVLHAWWKGSDTEYTTKHVDGRRIPEPYRKNGLRKPKIIDTNYRKTTGESIRRLYHTCWVVDTDIVYNYGLCTDIPFDYHDKDVRIPFVMFSIPGKSLVEQMVPILDNIQLTYLNLQNGLSKAPPPGLKIDIGSVENVSFGNKKVHPLDIIKVYSQTGNILYRLAPGEPLPNKTLNQNPIEQLMPSTDVIIINSLRAMESWFAEIERITGISQNAVSSTDPGQGLGVTQINLATTSNTLKPILTGWQTMKSNIGTYCANKIQSVIVNRSAADCPYYEILGGANYAAIKAAGKYPPVVWGCFVKAGLDIETKKSLMDAARAALQTGQDGVAILSFSDYLFIVDKIENGGNVASIRAFIAYREQKGREESMARANQAKVLEGKVNEQLALTKANSERESKVAEYQMEMSRIDKQFQADSALAVLNHRLKMRETPPSEPPIK